MLISGASAIQALASPYAYICIHIYNANLKGCGYSGVAFPRTHIYIPVHIFMMVLKASASRTVVFDICTNLNTCALVW